MFDASFENSFTGHTNEAPEEFGYYTAQLSVKSGEELLFKIWVVDPFSSCYEWNNQSVCLSKKPV